MAKKLKHIVIDARIRRASTGRPVDRLLEYLQDLDTPYKYTVILAKGDDWTPKNRKFSVVHSRFSIFSFNPLQQVLYARQLYRLKPDLVHFTMTGQQPLFYFGRQITFTHDLTMLRYVRAGKMPKWLHRLRMKGYRLLLWAAHRKAIKIIVPTEYVRDAVLKYHLFTQRKVVVALEAAEPAIAGEAESIEGVRKPFIFHVGSPFPHKNLRRLIKAFEILREKNPDLTLVLAGKKEYHFLKLEFWARRRDSFDSINFVGFVPDAQLKWLYENAEAYVLPSLSEGFGLPGLEAMVNGCPLVSSNETCLPEVYGEAAQYFDPRDVEDMASSIQRVLNGEKTRESLIEKGHVQAKKYSWKSFAQENVASYDSTLA
jgi:glycosyltransferase involved in cell wall biosynthesis